MTTQAKKRKSKAPTGPMSTDFMRKRGCLVAKTEHWNSFAKLHQDLFGFADMVALPNDSSGIIAVQTTAAPHYASKLQKMTDPKVLPKVMGWLTNGGLIEIHEWHKRDAKWIVRVYQIRASQDSIRAFPYHEYDRTAELIAG